MSRGVRSLLTKTLSCSRGHSRAVHSNQLVISREVSEAMKSGAPIVSLESTIITHGMPYPTNMEMAQEVEDIIRAAGATPATMAIMAGKIHVGLDRCRIEELATCRSPAVKTSRRDMPWVLSQAVNGGTTVSGTMMVSHMAGVDVFVTGGIGGVHRGGTVTMDVSADLTELGRTPVTVVSAGVKSILDIGLTLEYLETQGVCVATFGDTKAFPAFYTRDSGFLAPYNVTNSREVAKLIMANKSINSSSGILIGVPIPESDAAHGDKIEDAIKTAVEEAKEKNISGRDVTPYILSRLNDLTGGESLKANLALVKNNAKVGAGIAVELANMKNSGCVSPPVVNRDEGAPVVVGGSIYDFVVRLAEGELSLSGGTHGGSLRSSHGGVGRNVAAALGRLGAGPRLVSAVGEDREGRDILVSGQGAGVDTDMVMVDTTARTATYTAFLDSQGDCKFGVGDMDIHSLVSPAYIMSREDDLKMSSMIICDGNLSESSVHTLLQICSQHSVPFFYEPADLSKATKPLTSDHNNAITYTSPNLNELNSMLATLPSPPEQIKILPSDNIEEKVNEIGSAARQMLEHYGIKCIVVTLSENGVVIVRRGQPKDPLPTKTSLSRADLDDDISGVWYPCHNPCTDVVSVSGAGDCLTAGFITAVLQGHSQAAAVSGGMQAARLSCSVSAAVPDHLNHQDIDWNLDIEEIVLF